MEECCEASFTGGKVEEKNSFGPVIFIEMSFAGGKVEEEMSDGHVIFVMMLQTVIPIISLCYVFGAWEHVHGPLEMAELLELLAVPL